MAAHNHKAPLADLQQRVNALENALNENGLVNEATHDTITGHCENNLGPRKLLQVSHAHQHNARINAGDSL
ncbi:MAG: hypothetical protein ACU85U_08405 [Gammaproteobacteria bacterium]|jgi:hypothetical protein